MIRYFLFLLLWHGCLCVPGRPSKWHGKLSSSSGATLTAACGQVTTANNNPWTAILYINNVFQCGATILENQLAITAAHCVLGAHTDDLTLYYGRSFQPDSGLEDQGFDRFGGQTGVLAIRIHPNYNTFDQFEGNDIAVLKLVRRIRFNDFVKPIRVVPTHHKYDILYDRANVVRMASFGQTKGHIDSDNPEDWPDQMQEVEHRIVPEQTCNRGNDTFHFGPPRDGVCTRGRCRRKKNPGIQASFKQICKGDSGSGIVRLFQEENQYYLLAVVSYTVTHDEKVCGLSSLPSLSINTRDHRDFIYEDIFATSHSNEKGFETTTVSTRSNTSSKAPTISSKFTTPHTTTVLEASGEQCTLVKQRSPNRNPNCFGDEECKQQCGTVNDQQCSTVNEQVCSTVNEQQCSTVNKLECSTVNEQECRTLSEPICITIDEQECSTVNEHECSTEYIEICNIVVEEQCNNEQQCRNVESEQCRDVPQEQCTVVPRQQCRSVPQEQCINVPREKCSNVPRQQCRNVPRQQCSSVPRQQCTDVPRQQCSIVPRQQCGKQCNDIFWCEVCA